MSSTHTLPVNIFNLEGGEIALARDKENFRTPGENWTHDPPNNACLSDVPTTEPASPPLLFIAFFTSHRSPLSERLEQATEPEGREFDSCLGQGNFLCPGRAWFLLLPSWKCSLQMYVCCSLVYHYGPMVSCKKDFLCTLVVHFS